MTEPAYLNDTRTSYDTVAASYAELVGSEGPWEATCLDVFAGSVRPAQLRPVLDVGCGPGRVAGLLHDRGLRVIGVDLSPGMIEIARRDHPGPDFRIGSMTALDLPAGTLGGVVSWWSIIHLPRDVVPQALAEFHRVLSPGGTLLLGFHVGEGHRHKDSGYGGHPMSVDVYRWTPAQLTELATAAGFTPTVEVVTELDADVPQACLFFRK